jgi:hypothetical protein
VQPEFKKLDRVGHGHLLRQVQSLAGNGEARNR